MSGATTAPAAVPPELAPDGSFRSWARISWAVVGIYLFLIVLVLAVLIPQKASSYVWVPYFILALLAFYLVRYLSARYRIDDEELRASRLLGGRRVPLEEIRKIEYASLRDLVPTGAMAGMGSFGWHGRFHSDVIGDFDSVYTEPSRGVLVTGGPRPLYLTPRDPQAFARELSRRVRSYTKELEVDVGRPVGAQ
ncbi:MAG TPA: PH domain-containing protein [Thermoplasmata archaeon]|nr:PH domain-containing protein [Thermoplasmata archaeon]